MGQRQSHRHSGPLSRRNQTSDVLFKKASKQGVQSKSKRTMEHESVIEVNFMKIEAKDGAVISLADCDANESRVSKDEGAARILRVEHIQCDTNLPSHFQHLSSKRLNQLLSKSEEHYQNLEHYQNEEFQFSSSFAENPPNHRENPYTTTRASWNLPSLPDDVPGLEVIGESSAQWETLHMYENIYKTDQPVTVTSFTSSLEEEDRYQTLPNFDSTEPYARALYHSNTDQSNIPEDPTNINSVLPLVVDKEVYLTARGTEPKIVDRESSRQLREINQGSIRGKPVTNIFDCLPHNAKFSETVMFRIPIRNHRGSKLEVLYSPTNENEDPVWQKLRVVERTNGMILTDGANPPNYAVLPDEDGNEVTFLLRHFCAFVVIENGREELVRIAKVFVYLKSCLSQNTLVVDLLILAGCNEEAMNEYKELATKVQHFELIYLKEMVVYDGKGDIEVTLSDISWQKDIVTQSQRNLIIEKLLITRDACGISNFTQEFKNASHGKTHFIAQLTLRQLPNGTISIISISSDVKHMNPTDPHIHQKLVTGESATSIPNYLSECSNPIDLRCSSTEMPRTIAYEKPRDCFIAENKTSVCLESSLHSDNRSIENKTNSLKEHPSQMDTPATLQVGESLISNKSQKVDNQSIAFKSNGSACGRGPITTPTDDDDDEHSLLNQAIGGVEPSISTGIKVSKHERNENKSTAIDRNKTMDNIFNKYLSEKARESGASTSTPEERLHLTAMVPTNEVSPILGPFIN